MLEKPDLDDAKLIACLRDEFGTAVTGITFLPLGADRSTAVYRADTARGAAYFLKLRRGEFDGMTVTIPKILHDQGIEPIIPPLSTRSGALWASLDDFAVMLSPFVEGRNAYEVALTDAQWITFGQTLKGVHMATLPPEVANRLPRERYTAQWRDAVRDFMAMVERKSFTEPAAAKLAAFLRANRETVRELVERAERLGAILKDQPPDFVLCHADAHAWNLLIEADGTLWLVDWDTVILAPKERDLMFPGSGLFANRRRPEAEEALFYQGYGQAVVDPVALAYYRYERIVQDIAEYCEQLLSTDEGGADREEGLRQFMSQFQPDAVIDIAFRSDKALPPP